MSYFLMSPFVQLLANESLLLFGRRLDSFMSLVSFFHDNFSSPTWQVVLGGVRSQLIVTAAIWPHGSAAVRRGSPDRMAVPAIRIYIAERCQSDSSNKQVRLELRLGVLPRICRAIIGGAPESIFAASC